MIHEHLIYLNMLEKETIEKATSRLKEVAGITAKVTYSKKQERDGTITLKKGMDNLILAIEAKNNLRESALPYLKEAKSRSGNFLLISNYISDNVKQKLRDEGIFYLDTSGNAYINESNFFVLIQGLKEKNIEKSKVTKAFNATGLKLIHALLSDETLYVSTYRAIATHCEIALGSVAAVMNDLKELGYLIDLDENTRKMVRWRELLERWVIEYGETLRPRLFEEKYRLLNSNSHWKDIKLRTAKTVWGGEPAADILTDYLKPEKYILYTSESKGELMKNYKLVPDSGGDIIAYRWFWNPELNVKWTNDGTTGPILTYADLMLSNDSRNIQTAERIYEKYISFPA
jgi:hypothetical protein